MRKKMMRPHGLTYEMYKSRCEADNLKPLSKAAFENLPEAKEGKDDEDEDDDDDDDEEEEDAKKSKTGDVDPDALEKALADYESVEKGLDLAGDGGDRETYLKARMDAGTLTKVERKELGKIWAGDDVTIEDEPVQKSLEESIRDEEDDNGDLLDASPFLKSLTNGIEDRLQGLEGEVRGSHTANMELVKAQGGLIKSLVKGYVRQSRVIDALESRLNIVEKSPAPRRSVGADPRDVRNRDLGKSKVGNDGTEDKLSKSQVFTGLRGLMAKADNDRARDVIAHATAKFESTNQISRPLLEKVVAELAEGSK